VADGGRLESVAAAAEQVAGSLRSQEMALEFGFKVCGEVNWWFFAKNQAEGTSRLP
jgi:hypothetical protein